MLASCEPPKKAQFFGMKHVVFFFLTCSLSFSFGGIEFEQVLHTHTHAHKKNLNKSTGLHMRETETERVLEARGNVGTEMRSGGRRIVEVEVESAGARDRQVDGAGVTSERVSVTDSRGLEAFSGKPRQQGPPAGGDGQSSR